MFYFFYIAGVLLLCVPGVVLTKRWHRFASVAQIVEHRPMWWSWLHTTNLMDGLRAFTGALVLTHAFAGAADGGDGGMLARGLVAGVCVMGVLLQQFFYRLHERLVVPVAYMGGLMFVLLPAHVAGVALALGVATAIATRHIIWGLVIAGAAVAVMGVLFGVSPVESGAAAAILVSSALMEGLLHRRLVVTVETCREASRARRVEDQAARGWR